jgi:hypothetical protein
MGNQDGVSAGQGVIIVHHLVGMVDHSRMISKQFLSPTMNGMHRIIILEDFLDSSAIAEPIEESYPQEFFTLRDSPASASSFADERVVVMLLLGDFQESNQRRRKWAPPMPSSRRRVVAATKAGLSLGCMRMDPEPSALQSVFKKIGLARS